MALLGAGIACTGTPGRVVTVQGTTRLLPLLDAASWQPEVINLNNPPIAVRSADLGDGPVDVLYAHPPARVTWRLEPGRPLQLRTAVGLLPEAWDRSHDGVRFSVVLEHGGVEKSLYDRRLDPRRVPADRGWQPVLVDLSDWTGEAIRLSLETGIGPGNDPTYDWAAWNDPTLQLLP